MRLVGFILTTRAVLVILAARGCAGPHTSTPVVAAYISNTATAA